MTMLPHIASRVLDTPLVIGQAKLEAILAVIGPRIGVEAPAPAVVNGDTRRHGAYLVTPEGIAVIPVFGTLVKRAGAIEAASGLTSYGHLEEQIMDAATDPAVRAILLDIDSPGGEAAGVFDLADLVYEARSLKPVWAVADEAGVFRRLCHRQRRRATCSCRAPAASARSASSPFMSTARPATPWRGSAPPPSMPVRARTTSTRTRP